MDVLHECNAHRNRANCKGLRREKRAQSRGRSQARLSLGALTCCANLAGLSLFFAMLVHVVVAVVLVVVLL